MPSPRRSTPRAGGFPIALGALVGTAAGLAQGQATLGFLTGLAAGAAVAAFLWWHSR